jgi:SPP1 family predicted phage head-tail adaptor
VRPINPRSLTERLRIEKRVPADNELGEEVGGWAPVATVFARAEPIRSRELVAADQLQSAGDTRFIIRYRTDVVAAMRVIWRDKAYDIIGEPIDIEARRQWLEMTCTTGLRDGR